jgi:hypothetical protein
MTLTRTRRVMRYVVISSSKHSRCAPQGNRVHHLRIYKPTVLCFVRHSPTQPLLSLLLLLYIMSDTGRQSLTDKAAAALKPDSEKSKCVHRLSSCLPFTNPCLTAPSTSVTSSRAPATRWRPLFSLTARSRALRRLAIPSRATREFFNHGEQWACLTHPFQQRERPVVAAEGKGRRWSR